MMKIFVGSTNPAKLNAVKAVFADAEIEGLEVNSKVSLQPFSDNETLEGAINRALECARIKKDCLGIGLEGGVMEIEDELFLCNWGALVDPEGNIYKAGGARIPLPKEVAAELYKGKELSEVMETYTQVKGIRKKEGAIGVFTNQLLNRAEIFSHIVLMLKGQYEYYQGLKAGV
jgi:inosine/xanthosine triphosphatase